MPVTVDQVTAEVAPPERRGTGDGGGGGGQAPSPSDARKQREQMERMQIRCTRVHAD